MKQDLSGVAAAGLLAAIVFGVLAYSDRQARPAPATAAETQTAMIEAAQTADQAAIDAAAAAAESARPSQFTKVEFSNHVYGLTKGQIRAQFGSPNLVHGTDGSWFYTSLPVYDADAGIQVPVTIMFMGIGGPEDEVVGVDF